MKAVRIDETTIKLALAMIPAEAEAETLHEYLRRDLNESDDKTREIAVIIIDAIGRVF